MQSRNIGGGSACLLAALAERRPGRYRHETDSTWSNGNAGALHTLIVHADGSVSYVSEAHQCLASTTPIDPLPPAAPHRCALKPPGYFEACTAELAGRADAGPLRADSDAWACVFGDGDGLTPNNLYWFESCASEAAPACE